MTSPDPGFLPLVDRRVLEVLQVSPEDGSGPRVLSEAARHLCVGGGAKQFRPRLVQLFGGFFELPAEPLVRVAVASELIHGASLLHDDVIDAGRERRGRPTANLQWSNSVAVLAGDWLLTRATLEVAPLGLTLLREALETVQVMTAAAVREVEERGRTALTYETWRHIAQGKAGELFAWCLRSLATLGQAAELSEPLTALGHKLGVAFQMGDDLKDLLDTASGKDRFADLRNQNPSFALVVAMDCDPALRHAIARAWASSPSPAEIDALGQAVIDSGGLELAQVRLRDEVHASLALLTSVAPPKIVDEFVSLAASFAGRQASLLRGAA